LVKFGQKYWTLHKELKAFLYKAGGQILQYLCPFHRVPEDNGFIYAQLASITTYRGCCRHQGSDKTTTHIRADFFFVNNYTEKQNTQIILAQDVKFPR